MMKKAVIGLLIINIALTGFGAMPSKPDFAFPKTVSTTALAQLRAAEKKQDGPATVRALMDYSLAQVAIDPTKTAAQLQFMAEVQQRSKQPETQAMIQLLRATLQPSDSLAADAITKFQQTLRQAPVGPWRGVVDADERFFPTLYDFAVASGRDLPKAIVDEAIGYDADRLFPLIFLEMQRVDDFQEYMALYQRFKSTEVAIYPMLEMARSAHGIEQRKQAYDLLRGVRGADEALGYLTRPDIIIESNTIVGRGKELEVKVSATCLNKATIQVAMKRPVAKQLKAIELAFDGVGVFTADTIVKLCLDDYGEYELIPKFRGMTEKHPSRNTLCVTDFLLSRQTFGKKVSPALALDVINGEQIQGVAFRNERNRILGQRGADAYSPAIYGLEGYEPSKGLRRFANVLTDRAIYHPGDSVRFAATLMDVQGTRRTLAADKFVFVKLLNDNYQSVDTLRLTSDDYGRIHGAFLLPKDGLTGNFEIEVDDYGRQSFTVADYKAPTFDVKLTAERLDSTTVELRGSAVGYNGFALAQAQVALDIKELPMWVWARTFQQAWGNTIATDTVFTNANGEFSTRLKVAGNVNLAATATVSSPIGETHDAQAFIPWKRYFIEGNAGEFINADNPPAFRLLDTDNRAVDMPLDVTLNDTVADWANVKSGAYVLKVAAPDAYPLEFQVMVYRPTDKMPPAEMSLFVPMTTAKPGDKLLVGTSYGDSHIRMVVWTDDDIVCEKWLTPGKGNFLIDIELPDSVNDANITLHTLRNYRFAEKTVRVVRPVARSLDVQIESMRSKIVPGDIERWTVRVNNNLSDQTQAAVMLDVYSRALDALLPLRWGFNQPGVYAKHLSFNDAPSYADKAYNSLSPRIANPLRSVAPHFNLRGQYWPRQETVNGMFYMSAKRFMGVQELKEECVVEDCRAEATADCGRADGMDDAGSQLPQAGEYRLPEVPVAMWQPVLTTAADGKLEITFTAPNANTTWAVRVLAYNKQLLSGLFDSEIIAQKPLMVQPQLPRFMRQGDETVLKAMVQNATDSVQLANAKIEVFNPADNTVIQLNEFAVEITAQGYALIQSEFIAPASAAFVAVRVRASNGQFADGEETLIPILPAQMNITTGKSLFAPTDSSEITVNVPRGGTLTFTANAAWECVAALPGLSARPGRCALSAADQLFSAATARGLMRQHPEIARALHSWEKDDSILLSRLMCNADLKIALLSSTPWVQAAQNETDRRMRLLLLFDNRQIDNTVSDAVATLAKLQRKGGLAWVEGNDEPSEWITLRVLSTIADLRKSGYLPQDKTLSKLIAGAVEYLDKEVARSFAKNPKATYPAYVLLRQQFPEVRQSAPARRAAAATVQNVVGHWRDYPLSSLPAAALILNDNGYRTTARQLLESMRQRQAWEQLPLNPTLLSAFATIEPDCPDVEIIRNDYLRRAQSAGWGESSEASALIAAIINSGDTWLVPAANSIHVKVNGHEVMPEANGFLGRFRLDFPQGGKVEITKGRFPAWGGVFSSSAGSLNAVKPFSSEEIKISREIQGQMKPGEKLVLTLTLEAAQDMDYVLVTQPLCAGFETADQLPGHFRAGIAGGYREPLSTQVNWYINRLPKGKTIIRETFYITAAGEFALAPAQAQSQYAPAFQSHTAGRTLKIF